MTGRNTVMYCVYANTQGYCDERGRSVTVAGRWRDGGGTGAGRVGRCEALQLF